MKTPPIQLTNATIKTLRKGQIARFARWLFQRKQWQFLLPIGYTQIRFPTTEPLTVMVIESDNGGGIIKAKMNPSAHFETYPHKYNEN